MVYHHRGAYLMALGTVAAWALPPHPAYLSVVPMFHCHGWNHPWAMAVVGGRMVFARDMTPAAMIEAIRRHRVTQGEIAIRGNTVMTGHYEDRAASEAAFQGGWFWSGGAAVVHPDGYVQIRDRLKDVIISGGENISSVEVEAVLYRHPAGQAAAVVARPHARWGETPCAFVELRAGAGATEAAREMAEQG